VENKIDIDSINENSDSDCDLDSGGSKLDSQVLESKIQYHNLNAKNCRGFKNQYLKGTLYCTNNHL